MRRRIILAIGIVLAAAAALLACIDLTPIAIPPGEAPESSADGMAADDASDGPRVDFRPPCVRCLENDGGPCHDELAACANDPQCIQIVNCAAAAGCLDLASVQAVVGCGIPCAEDAGLRSQFDPPGQEILALILCAQQACVAECPWGGDH